jgi:metallo-beta-lactamase family protein
MRIIFHGAAKEVTGSAHVFEVNGKRILLDCGLYQGKRKEAFEKNRQFPYDPKSLDAVVLSHAHMDHSGNLPTLVKGGFDGPIYCTEATADLCSIMFRDCAYIQIKDVEYINKSRIRENKTPFEPLYSAEEAVLATNRIVPIPYNKVTKIFDNVELTLTEAGHILGSAFVTLDCKENGSRRRLTFTGDIGRRDIPILKDPYFPGGMDYLITESTYGDRRHPAREDVKIHLAEYINEICQRKSKMIIPAFSIGRTQHLVYLLNQLFTEGKICQVPVYVDSPLSSAATTIYDRHVECWDTEAIHSIINNGKPFSFSGLHYTESVAESMALNDKPGPMIIISASGMVEAGRIIHHMKNNIENPDNIILIVGYMAENTLGRRIAEKSPEVKIFGQMIPLNAQVEEVAALSAHADKYEMLDLFERNRPEQVKHAFCVHGEEAALNHFSGCLKEIGMQQVSIPSPGQAFDLN